MKPTVAVEPLVLKREWPYQLLLAPVLASRTKFRSFIGIRALNIKTAVISNIMEDDKDDIEVKDGGFSIKFAPFKVITVKLYLA